MTEYIGRRIVVVGGTSAIAIHTLRSWLAEGDASVHLLGRSDARLASVASDLRVRFPASSITHEAADLVDPDSITRVVDRLVDEGGPDLVLIAHGALANDDGVQDLRATFDDLVATGLSPALWLIAFAERLTRGTIAILGSVAGDRGRKSNYVYGAAKGLIERVAQGLQNRFTGTDLHVVLIKPGPTRTPMTRHLAAAGARLADVHTVGEKVARAVTKNRLVVYVPGSWRLVMAVVRSIPAPVFNRLDL
jgi:decaprenylphospho-beta-D-erythro-pentofuranosid-2-ulose 2-reductase